MTQPITDANAHQAEQPPLPITWFAPHQHADQPPHQHFDHHDDDPHEGIASVPFDPAAADRAQQHSALQRVRTANQARHATLAQQGVQIQPMGISLMRIQAQLDALLSATLTEEARLGFELAFETQIAAGLDQIEEAVPAMKLQAPMPGGPNGSALLIPPGYQQGRG